MLLLSLPALTSRAWLVFIRARASVETFVLLAGWGGICLVFLGRHAACVSGLAEGGICRILVISPHHFHVDLQAAEACVTGWALCLALARLAPRFRPAVATISAIAIWIGIASLFQYRWYHEARAAVLANLDTILDRLAYD